MKLSKWSRTKRGNDRTRGQNEPERGNLGQITIGQCGQMKDIKNIVIINIYNIIILMSCCPTLFHILYVSQLSPYGVDIYTACRTIGHC